MPLAAATTGVKGLEVVVPVSPNTSYYHYYRSNGLVRSPGGYLGEDVDVLYDFIASGDTDGPRQLRLASGRMASFAGTERPGSRDGRLQRLLERSATCCRFVKNIKAAVLLAHGFNDYNVVPEHSVRIYDEMKARGLPVSIYLHQGGHGGNPPADMLNRWFSHYLYGVDNGVEKDPPVWIVQDAAAQEPRAVVAAAAVAQRRLLKRHAGDCGPRPGFHGERRRPRAGTGTRCASRRRRRSRRSRFRDRCRSCFIRPPAATHVANLSAHAA